MNKGSSIINRYSVFVCILICITSALCLAHSKTPHPTISVSEQLGWVSLNQKDSLCRGAYQDSILIQGSQSIKALNKSSTLISADETFFSQKETSHLVGHVQIKQPGRLFTADKALLFRNVKTGKIDHIQLIGNVRLEELGKLLAGEKADIKLYQAKGTLQNAIFRISLDNKPVATSIITKTKKADKHKHYYEGLNFWGQAKEIEQIAPNIYLLEQATASSCPPNQVSWQIRAKTIKLNRKTGTGTAKQATLHFHGIPILYLPYYSFPLDKRRKAGFLSPTYGHTRDSGFLAGIPFYWNIALNYDATFTPALFTKRGFFGKADFRYLQGNGYGKIHGTFIPYDRQFKKFRNGAAARYPVASFPSVTELLKASNDRYFLSWEDRHYFGPHWSSEINLKHVSDDYYLQDFAENAASYTTNQLLEKVAIHYRNPIWKMGASLQAYETLHPVNRTTVANQYARLPELYANAKFPTGVSGLNIKLASQYTYFTIEKNPGATVLPPIGQRLFLQPTISRPYHFDTGFITPELKLHSTQYYLQNPAIPNPKASTRVLPMFDIHSGLYFDRTTQWGEGTYRHTLEPELFYLYVPYKNQSNLPNFDSAYYIFNFSQLFRTNRFSGLDRVQNANQFSMALASRLIRDSDGIEKLRASIGIIYYLEHRKVTICTTTACSDLLRSIGATSLSNRFSPVAGLLNYSINPHWETSASFAWNFSQNQANNANIYVQYRPNNDHVINLGYTFLQNGDILSTGGSSEGQNNLSQTNVSFAWRLNPRWNVLGQWNYNLSKSRNQVFLYGLEYQSCCWAIRVLGSRAFTALDSSNRPSFDNAVYLQLRLNGLGSAGNSDPEKLINSSIPGYIDNFSMLNKR